MNLWGGGWTAAGAMSRLLSLSDSEFVWFPVTVKEKVRATPHHADRGGPMDPNGPSPGWDRFQGHILFSGPNASHWYLSTSGYHIISGYYILRTFEVVAYIMVKLPFLYYIHNKSSRSAHRATGHSFPSSRKPLAERVSGVGEAVVFRTLSRRLILPRIIIRYTL